MSTPRISNRDQFVIAAVLSVIAVFAMTYGLTRVGGTELVVVGTATALVGILLVHNAFFNQRAFQGWKAFWCGVAVYAVPLGLLILYEEYPPVVIVALAVISAVGVAVLAAALRLLYEDPDRGRTVRRVVGGLGVALTLLGLAGLLLSGASNPLLLASLGVTFFGIVAWGFALVVSCKTSENAWRWAVGAAGALVVFAVVALVLAAAEVSPLYLLLPAAGAGAALVPLSQAMPNLLETDQIGDRVFGLVAIGVIGAALGALASLIFAGDEWSLGITAVVVAGLAMVALAYVLDVSALALFVLVVVVLAGVMIDRSGGELAAGDGGRLVVFGDSYISGEGAYEFIEGTNIAVSDQASTPTSNECRVAATAHPNLLATWKNWTLETYACSGARTKDIAALDAGPVTRKPATQLKEFAANGGTAGGDVAAVLISVGGNDAWFGAIGQACLGPGSCEVHRDSVMRNLRVVGGRVGEVYEAVKEAVGYPDVPVYAIPYPLVMTRSGCADSPLTNAEQEFLFEFSEVLNETIRVEAERAGINWVTEAIAAQAGHRMCEAEALSVNLVDVLPKEGPLSARIIPTNWVKGSAHPYELGHALTFEAIRPVFEGELTNPPDTGLVRPSVIRPRTTPVSRGALGIPPDRNCGDQEVPVSLIVQSVTTNSDPDLPGIGESSPVCMNLPNGGWIRWETFDAAGRDATWDTEQAKAVPEAERPEFHWITYQNENGAWRAVVYQYCDLRSDCVDTESDLNDWMQQEIEATVRSSVVPAILVFAAFWFGFMWIRDLTSRAEPTNNDQVC
jgi:hypothetical protein